jgi:hypothetical protein
VTRHSHSCDTLASIECRVARVGSVAERRHETISEPLYDLSAPRQDRRLDRGAHFAQELDGKLVAHSQRPLREADQVREQHRDVNLSATSALGLGESLPALQNRRAELPRYPRLIRAERSELTKRQIRGSPARAGQPVLDLLLAQCPLASLAGGAEKRRAAVESTGGGCQPSGAAGARSVAHGRSVDQLCSSGASRIARGIPG